MKTIRTIIHHLLRQDDGQDLIEYALVAALIGLAAVAALNTLSGDVTGIFTSIGTSLSTAII
jgi:pilus assembly protein Flp/PilA